MWEYRWLDVCTDETDRVLTEVGRDGWEAVGTTDRGRHLGRQWAAVLLKRTTDSITLPEPAPATPAAESSDLALLDPGALVAGLPRGNFADRSAPVA